MRKINNRGHLTTSAKRAAQCEDPEVRGDGKCWCSGCHVVINVTKKSTATNHIATQGHTKRKLEATKVDNQPGVSAAMEDTQARLQQHLHTLNATRWMPHLPNRMAVCR